SWTASATTSPVMRPMASQTWDRSVSKDRRRRVSESASVPRAWPTRERNEGMALFLRRVKGDGLNVVVGREELANRSVFGLDLTQRGHNIKQGTRLATVLLKGTEQTAGTRVGVAQRRTQLFGLGDQLVDARRAISCRCCILVFVGAVVRGRSGHGRRSLRSWRRCVHRGVRDRRGGIRRGVGGAVRSRGHGASS